MKMVNGLKLLIAKIWTKLKPKKREYSFAEWMVINQIVTFHDDGSKRLHMTKLLATKRGKNHMRKLLKSMSDT